MILTVSVALSQSLLLVTATRFHVLVLVDRMIASTQHKEIQTGIPVQILFLVVRSLLEDRLYSRLQIWTLAKRLCHFPRDFKSARE